MINKQELEKLQNLAKIDLAPDEQEQFLNKLTTVIKMIDRLREVDCTDVKPLRSVCNMEQRLVADEVENCNIDIQLFKNVPKQNAKLAREAKCFVVPKVIE